MDESRRDSGSKFGPAVPASAVTSEEL